MAAPQNVSATVLAGGDILVEWDLDEVSGWNGADIRYYEDVPVPTSVAVHIDLPDESELPRREFASDGSTPYNPPLDVRNHYRHTTPLPSGNYRFEVRFTNRAPMNLIDSSAWSSSNQVGVSQAPNTYGTLDDVTEAGVLTHAPIAYKSRLMVWRLIGGTLADSQQAIDQGSVSFGSAGNRFGGAGGDWATYRTNEIDPIIAKSPKIAHMLSRPFGMRLVPENTASDTAVDRYAMGRSQDQTSLNWRQGGMLSPLECVELGTDDVLLDDFQATMSGLADEGIPVVCHCGLNLQNMTHDATAIDGTDILGTFVPARTHIYLDAHLGVSLTDDRNGQNTPTHDVADRMDELGMTLGLEGRLLKDLSEQWFTATTPNIDAMIECDLFLPGIDQGVDTSNPLTGGNFTDDPDPDYFQPSDYPDRRFVVIIDGSTDYVSGGADLAAKAARAKELHLACMNLAPNVYTTISGTYMDTYSQDDIDEMVEAASLPIKDASLSLEIEKAHNLNLAIEKAHGMTLAIESADYSMSLDLEKEHTITLSVATSHNLSLEVGDDG